MKTNHLLLIAGIFSASFASAAKNVSFATDTFKTRNNKEVIITFIKHGSLMLKYNDQYIQVDPVSTFADYAAFPKASIILVTHEHGDHLDAKAIETLTKKKTLLVTTKAVKKILNKGDVLENGNTLKVSNKISIEAVPAYNTTPGREKFHPLNSGNGYVLSIDGLRIYISGDTEDIPEMRNIKNIDIAFLAVNQPYTMTVPQTSNAAKMIIPKVLYPYHYGDTDILQLKEALKNTAIDVRIKEMK